MRRYLIVLLVAGALTGCATPYRQMGLFGGVNASQIDTTTMRVSARGNAFTDIGQIRDYVLLRAAEETLAHGYDLFRVVGEYDATSHETFTSDDSYTAPTIGMGISPSGPVPVMGLGKVSSSSTHSVSKPGEDIMIKMSNGAIMPHAPLGTYDARDVVAHLGPKLRR